MSRWQYLEDSVMRRTYAEYGREVSQSVLRRLGFRRSRRAIICRAKKLLISHKHWSGREDWIIEQCYPTYGARYTQRYMPKRSVIAIRDRARRIGIASQVKCWGEMPAEHDHIKAIAWLGVKYRGK